MRVVFAGTPEPAVPVLQALIDSEHSVVGVLTRPDAPKGRGRTLHPSPVAALAAEHGIPTIKTATLKTPEVQDQLRALNPDCIPVVAYGALVPKEALDLPRYGWVNLHFSVLPAWRGAAPVQASIHAGETETGITFFRINEGLDTGDILATRPHPIAPTDTAGSLLETLAQFGATVFPDVLSDLENGRITLQPQPEEGASYAAKISVDDARVDWTQPAARIDCLIRSVTPAPGAWTTNGDDRIKLGPVTPIVTPGDPIEDALQLAPGEMAWKKNRVWVGTGDVPVKLSTVQAPGKKMMNAGDWIRGARLAEGTVLK